MIKRLLQSETARKHFIQVFKFAVIGSLGAFIDIGTVTILHRIFDVHAIIAGTISTFLSVTTVFFLNKYITFRSHGEPIQDQIIKFVLVYGLSIVMNIGLYSLFVWWGIMPEISKAIAIIIGAFWNYLWSHMFVFKKKSPLSESSVEEQPSM